MPKSIEKLGGGACKNRASGRGWGSGLEEVLLRLTLKA